MRRLQALLAVWVLLLPFALRVSHPLVHEPCIGKVAVAECPTCLAIVTSSAAVVPAFAALPGPTRDQTPAVAEAASPPQLAEQLPTSSRGPPTT